MDYDKLIIVDFDDTLCLHPEDNKSDIPNGRPHYNLINKLKDMKQKGYTIHIYTARGHLSTGSREEADTKYRPIIQDWLDRYNVPCDKLDFNKPYGIIYIDDKAIRPDEYSKLDEL